MRNNIKETWLDLSGNEIISQWKSKNISFFENITELIQNKTNIKDFLKTNFKGNTDYIYIGITFLLISFILNILYIFN